MMAELRNTVAGPLTRTSPVGGAASPLPKITLSVSWLGIIPGTSMEFQLLALSQLPLPARLARGRQWAVLGIGASSTVISKKSISTVLCVEAPPELNDMFDG